MMSMAGSWGRTRTWSVVRGRCNNIIFPVFLFPSAHIFSSIPLLKSPSPLLSSYSSPSLGFFLGTDDLLRSPPRLTLVSVLKIISAANSFYGVHVTTQESADRISSCLSDGVLGVYLRSSTPSPVATSHSASAQFRRVIDSIIADYGLGGRRWWNRKIKKSLTFSRQLVRKWILNICGIFFFKWP